MFILSLCEKESRIGMRIRLAKYGYFIAKKARVRSISEIEHAMTMRAVRRFSPFDWLRQPFS